jgi:hypothetical protein
MIENGARGLDAVDATYNEDPENYGVDFQELGDEALAQSFLARQREAQLGNARTLDAAPPRWSRVTVDPPAPSPFSPEQLQELQVYIESRVDMADGRMQTRREVWNLGLRYCLHLLHVNA